MTLSSAREALKSHSTPSAELPALEFSLPSHYAPCPRPPPLIDLGPVPGSNCFLQIGFALIADSCLVMCVLYVVPFHATLTNVLSSLRSCGFDPSAHTRAPRTMLTSFFVLPWNSGVNWKKKSRKLCFFPIQPSFPPGTHFCVWIYCGCQPCYLTENFSRGMAGWRIQCVTLCLRSLKCSFFSFPIVTHVPG